jgi:hypothetical protein
MEMRNRANNYNSETQSQLRAAFLGEAETGGPPVISDPEAHFIRPTFGELTEAEWNLPRERQAMDMGYNIPVGRTRGELVKVNLVRDVTLERILSANRSQGFTRFYDRFNIGATRGYIREAALRPDLAEGVRWLSLVRTRAFPTVEGGWQRIKRSGRDPPFQRGRCPLCSCSLQQNWEWAHLLVSCTSVPVRLARLEYLDQSIAYLRRNLENRPLLATGIMTEMGREEQIGTSEVLSIYLIGGLYRHLALQDGEGWFDTYFLGFGAARLITPGFESYGFVYITQFLQRVAPLYVARLGLPLDGAESIDTDDNSSVGSVESVESPTNQRHMWWTEGDDRSPHLDQSESPLDP